MAVMIGRAVAGRPRDVEKRENIRAAFMDPKNAGIGMKGMIALTEARGEMVREVRDDLLAAGAISRDALKRETAEGRARAALLAAPERTNAKLAGETGLPVHAFSNARAKLRRSGKIAPANPGAKRKRILAAWRDGERSARKIVDLAGASKGYVNWVIGGIGADRAGFRIGKY